MLLIHDYVNNLIEFFCRPDSPVGGAQDLRTGVRWFDPRGLIIVIVTGFIPLSPLSSVSTMIVSDSSQWLGKNSVRNTG